MKYSDVFKNKRLSRAQLKSVLQDIFKELKSEGFYFPEISFDKKEFKKSIKITFNIKMGGKTYFDIRGNEKLSKISIKEMLKQRTSLLLKSPTTQKLKNMLWNFYEKNGIYNSTFKIITYETKSRLGVNLKSIHIRVFEGKK